MNKLQIFALKSLRKVYQVIFKTDGNNKSECIQDADLASQLIYEALISDKPCMIGRFGANELLCIVTYLGIKENNKNIFSYITGKSQAWWWNEQNLINMNIVAGFFPPEIDKYEKFCEIMLRDIPEVDVLGSWLLDENKFKVQLEKSHKIWLDYLNPFFAKKPWSKALNGKKILVVHPFAETIQNQYKNRKLLFKDPNVLPEFELTTIKAIQSIANEKNKFKDWFEALDFMKNEIDKSDFDICLIGAGAYGFPLAAHVKRKGKKAVHLGGSLQLLFGIKGKRWEELKVNKNYSFKDYFNQYWVRPSEIDTPKNFKMAEDGCYW